MGSEPMRVVGYCRVSTEEQARDGVSLLAQAERVRDYCRLYGLQLVCVISDPGESASSLARPGLLEVRQLIERGEASGLVVTKLDRLTRSVRDLGDLLETWLHPEKGAQLMSVGDQIDTRTASGRLVLNILMSVAQWEREAIVERTKVAIDHKRDRGERIGTIPYGWDLGEDGKTLVANQAELDVLVAMRSWWDAGKSARWIASELTRQKIPTKRGRPRWSPSSIPAIIVRASAQGRRP